LLGLFAKIFWWPENENRYGEKGNKDCWDNYYQRINIWIDHSFQIMSDEGTRVSQRGLIFGS